MTYLEEMVKSCHLLKNMHSVLTHMHVCWCMCPCVSVCLCVHKVSVISVISVECSACVHFFSDFISLLIHTLVLGQPLNEAIFDVAEALQPNTLGE